MLAGERLAAIGHTAALERPDWATAHFGDPPEDLAGRERWVAAAGVAGGYRELAGLDDAAVSLGVVPSPEQVLHRALWEHAATALGQTTDLDDPRAASDGELRERVACWERARSWAPDHVAPQLRDAHLEADQLRRDAVVAGSRLAEALAIHNPEYAALAAALSGFPTFDDGRRWWYEARRGDRSSLRRTQKQVTSAFQDTLDTIDDAAGLLGKEAEKAGGEVRTERAALPGQLEEARRAVVAGLGSHRPPVRYRPCVRIGVLVVVLATVTAIVVRFRALLA